MYFDYLCVYCIVFDLYKFDPKCNVQDIGLFKMVLYTNDYFVKDHNLRYESEEVYAYSGQDPDYWYYFELYDLINGVES